MRESGSIVKILGVRINNFTRKEAINKFIELLSEEDKSIVMGVNVFLLVECNQNDQLKSFYNNIDLLNLDGMGIYYASRILSNPIKEMVGGPEFWSDTLHILNEKEGSIYILGSTPEIITKVIERIKLQFNKIRLAGYSDGYFTEDRSKEIVKEIAQSNADVLYIGMPTPLKEYFIRDNIEDLNVGVLIGVGGWLDVFAGVYKLAPPLISKLGLEWLYRMIQEPRRLFMRYLRSNSKFLLLIANEKLRKQ